ncbi:MAG: acetyl-CoA carboxylase biotin carboxyl carrier protein subunit [Candidatus Kapabacteria bacterium]|nr:acetyl-CoA carboxylase biotin carboxyl carrier protein subunit [Candidatus Kapabacteria bacterium]
MNEQYTGFNIDDTTYVTKINKKFADRKRFDGIDLSKITAFIPGTIREIYAKTGQIVKQGDTLLILEAMKMKNQLKAPLNGKVKEILVKTGDMVSKNQVLVRLEPEERK